MSKEYTLREISEILNTYPETLGRSIRDGKLRAHKKPGDPKWYVTENDLESFVDMHAVYGWTYKAYKRRIEEENLKETDPKTYYQNKMRQALAGIESMQRTLDRHYKQLQRILEEEP